MRITLFNDGWNEWRDLAAIAKAANQPIEQTLEQLKDLFKQGLIEKTSATNWRLKTNPTKGESK